MRGTDTASDEGSSRWRALRARAEPTVPAIRAVAGPALIVLAVLVVMRSFVLHDHLTVQHGDILEQWLPFYCFQGHALAAGHVPSFQPFALAGAPFAGDPQSGWMYLPAMLLFTALPCGTAMRWFLVLQPIVAGLGAYAFLRAEGAGRVAATAAGLVLALVIADSYFGLEVPFAGAVAWTAVSLAAAARYLRADRWRARIGWLLALTVAWGQIAAAHLSDGFVVGSLALAAYAAARLISDVRAGKRSWRQAAGLVGMAILALPAVNLAFALPRVAYLHQTTLGLGYTKLLSLSGQLTGHPYVAKTYHRSLFDGGTWILGLAGSPGSYLGAAGCALAFAGPRSRRHRAVAVAFLAFTAGCWLVGQSAVATFVGRHVGGLPLVEFYVHAPARFRAGALLALPIAIGFGVHAWLEDRSLRDRLLMLAPGLVLWWLLPAAVGLPAAFPTVFLVGTVAAGIVLGLTVWRPALAWVIPSLLVVELVANGVLGGRASPGAPTSAPWGPLRRPAVDAGAYLRTGAIADAIASGGVGRFASLVPGGLDKQGRHDLLAPNGWPALGDQQSMVFGLSDVGGYNPTQPLRYWSFVRMTDHRQLNYNSAYLVTPLPSIALDLLQVRWLVAPAAGPSPVPGARPVVLEGQWQLYELPDASPRASVVSGWRVVGSSQDALRAVTTAGFDAAAQVVLEHDPGITQGAGGVAGSATYIAQGPQAATVQVHAGEASLVLIRNVFDPRWHATVDGANAPVLAADGVDQAVAVPAGAHTVRLTYDDPSVGLGLAGSGVSAGGLAIVAVALGLRSRRRRRSNLRSDDAVADR